MFGEIMRIIENLIKPGVVAETDAAGGLVRVRHGGLLSDWLPYFVPAAGAVSVHRPPSVGEACLILSPSGEPGNGFALCGIKSTDHPQPAVSPDKTVIKFADGAVIGYDHAAGELDVSGIGAVKIEAAETVTIDCPQNTITGALTVQGLLTYQAGLSGSGGAGGTQITGSFSHQGDFANTGSISSNGVRLDTHTHPDTTSGGNTGEPNK